jgi:phage baseplate assembly protein W
MSMGFLGKGLRFPFAFQKRSGGAQVSTVTSLDHAHIHESILQILGTRPGERLMNPEFGSRLKDLVFEPNDFVFKGLIRRYVIDAIERWETRVYVTDVTFDDSPETVDANTIPVRISYRVIDTQVEGNLVWPFCREELVGSSDTDTRRATIG